MMPSAPSPFGGDGSSGISSNSSRSARLKSSFCESQGTPNKRAQQSNVLSSGICTLDDAFLHWKQLLHWNWMC